VIEADTNEQGEYAFLQLDPGQYSMTYAFTFESCQEGTVKLPDIDANWLSATGINKAGDFVLIAASSAFTVTAGDLLQMDFELSGLCRE
jgi:hypothetical protein